jgi:hypothetical protein
LAVNDRFAAAEVEDDQIACLRDRAALVPTDEVQGGVGNEIVEGAGVAVGDGADLFGGPREAKPSSVVQVTSNGSSSWEGPAGVSCSRTWTTPVSVSVVHPPVHTLTTG